jgi:transposase, IS5 family
MKQPSLFDGSDRLQELSHLGDPLEKLNRVIDWGIFQPILNKVLKKERKGVQGRPPYPYLMMFKILVLQRLYNISEWLFRENLVNAGVHNN